MLLECIRDNTVCRKLDHCPGRPLDKEALEAERSGRAVEVVVSPSRAPPVRPGHLDRVEGSPQCRAAQQILVIALQVSGVIVYEICSRGAAECLRVVYRDLNLR